MGENLSKQDLMLGEVGGVEGILCLCRLWRAGKNSRIWSSTDRQNLSNPAVVYAKIVQRELK